MFKNFAKCAALLAVCTTALTTTTFAADNAFLEGTADKYSAVTKSEVVYYQTNDVDKTAEKSEVRVSSKETPYSTCTEKTDSLLLGTSKVSQKGVNGVNKVTEVIKYVNDEIADVSVAEEVISEPVDEIILEGTKEEEVYDYSYEDSSFDNAGYSKVITMSATAYCPCKKCCGANAQGITANGMKAGYGVVAVDRKVIPLGTKLYVEGYGYCIAADTGGAIKGNRIDLCYNTHQEALNSGFGHTNVRVYVLD